MKYFFKKIVVSIITFEARLVLWRHKSKVVAITGSVGKTSTKEAVAAVLRGGFRVRKSQKSYNSEIGAPLTILNCESGWLNPFWWFFNILKGLRAFLIKGDPVEWFVLEIGVERPGDMKKLISWIRPHVAVVTALADIPPHVEFFAGPKTLAREKAQILKDLEINDFAVLNSDDDAVLDLKNKTKAKIITFGFGEDANLVASNYSVRKDGITFKVDCDGSSIPVRLLNVFGKHHVYPVLAAFAVGQAAGLNLVEMAEALAFYYESPPGRLKLIDGVKNSFILDDTYNSSPMALRAALEAMAEIPAERKIVVLGDMLELGKYTIESHQAMAEYVVKSGAEIVFTIGPRMKFLAQALRERNFDASKIFEFSTSDEAKRKVEEVMEEGDLILVKGSQLMRMEKIAEEIMAEPERKQDLLVRQDKAWQNR